MTSPETLSTARPTTQDAPADLRQRCRQMVQQLYTAYGWSLLSMDALVEAAVAQLALDATDVTDRALYRTVLNCYTLTLYEACRAHGHQARCALAYTELYQLLLRNAVKSRPDLSAEMAEEVAQRALFLTFEQLDRCQKPTSFIAFALYKLRQAFTEQDRYREKEVIGAVDAAPDMAASPAAQVVWQMEEQQRVEQVALDAALAALADPRLRQVIVWKFIGGWSDEEIATELGLTANHVRVLRNRGLAQLRTLLDEG